MATLDNVEVRDLPVPVTLDRMVETLDAHTRAIVSGFDSLATVLGQMADSLNSLHFRFDNLEILMADLGPRLDRLEAAVRNLDPEGLRAALEAERARTAELLTAAAAAESLRLDLATAEDAEDVQQNAELLAAVTAYNQSVAATDEAASRLDAVTETLEGFGSEPTDPGEPAPPVDPEPVPVDPTLPVDPTAPVDPEPVPGDGGVVNPPDPGSDDGVIRG